MFDWDLYMSVTGSSPVHHESFQHVEESLRCVIKDNSLCEVESGPGGSVWFAHIKLVCGPLLHLAHLHPLLQDQELKYFWFDLRKDDIFRFGHARINKLVVRPMKSSENKENNSEKHKNESEADVEKPKNDNRGKSDKTVLYEAVEELVKKHGWHLLDTDFPRGSKTTVADRIKIGRRFELREEDDPTKFWVVTVIENLGGLLGLRYTSPDLKGETDLRLFHNHPRLKPCGSVERSQGAYQFKVPDKLMAIGYPPQVWKVLKSSFSDGSIKGEEDQDDRNKPPISHSFQEKMLLAVIDPRDRSAFRVGIVDTVYDKFYFKIALLEEPSVAIVCTKDCQEIGSIPWAISLGLLDKKSLQDMPCSPQSKIAPRSLFPCFTTRSTGATPVFLPGQVLEYLHDPDKSLFHLASVVEAKENIVKLKVMFCEGSRELILGSTSLALFPVGWAASNNINLVTPPSVTSQITVEPAASSNSTENEGLDTSQEQESSKPLLSGYWCPPIYFNHLCYSASFLRKPRLEALPRYIGPGPVRLVMREVLAKLVASSFKSGAVLKKLEVGEVRRPDFWIERMKGKSRVLLLEGEVEVPSRAEQVTEFCREVCQKLECCPYLFGPIRVGSECPSACQTRPKHEFLLEQSKLSKTKGRKGAAKKKGKKVVGEGTEPKGEESSSDDTSATPSCATTRDVSRDGSPEREGVALKRRRTSDPEAESPVPKRRRLADSADDQSLQQLKVKPTRAEMEEMEELIEESLRESPSPPPVLRPPSPKLLRSRTSLLLAATEPTKTTSTVASATEPELNPALMNLDLEAAFSYQDLPIPPVMLEPPPVQKVILKSNPVLWTHIDVFDFMGGLTDKDLVALAPNMKHEQIDGMAFLLLNLPTILDHWRIKFSTAYKLCRLVEAVKLAFYLQYAHTGRRPQA